MKEEIKAIIEKFCNLPSDELVVTSTDGPVNRVGVLPEFLIHRNPVL